MNKRALLKSEMQQWLASYCDDNIRLELQLRNILKQHEKLIGKINEYFDQGHVEELKEMIIGYIKMDIEKIPCPKCNRMNFLLITASNVTCYECNETIPSPKANRNKRCLYCSNPVASISDMTCYSCRGIKFKYY